MKIVEIISLVVKKLFLDHLQNKEDDMFLYH